MISSTSRTAAVMARRGLINSSVSARELVSDVVGPRGGGGVTVSSSSFSGMTRGRRWFSTTSSMDSLLFNPTPEHTALRASLRSFVASEVEPQANDYNNREVFNEALFRKKLGTMEDEGLGILGLTVPEEYGGTGWLDATAVVLVHEELSYSDPAFCLSYLAHSLLLTHNLATNSTQEQQKLRFLPPCCSGEFIGGMAMSEPNAGTDVLGMQTTATLTPDGEHYILNGTKLWITNGYLQLSSSSSSSPNDTTSKMETGDLFLVYAKTGPSRSDVTLFLVEKGMPGFSVGQAIRPKLGMRASPTAELVLDQVHVPVATHVVGQINGALLCMMRNLEIERLALAAMAVGIARRCLDDMKSYASQRNAFGKSSLFEFGQIQHLMAESYGQYMAGKSYVYATARALDLTSMGNTLNADGTKLFCAPMAKQVADNAIQIMGGNGYTAEYKVERLWRDAKLLEIGGGTNQSHHKNMARDFQQRASEPLE